MAGFVNTENTAHRPDGIYGEVIAQIKKEGICPFCPGNLMKHHTNPILAEGSCWILTKNAFPYENVKHHILIIHKNHIERIEEVSPEAWIELKSLIETFSKENNIPGGTIVMRFGNTAYTGATVSHLHANFVSPNGEDENREPIIARIG